MTLGLKADKVFKYTNGNLMKDNAKNKFDEYFTKPEIAKQLFDRFCQIVGQKEDLAKFCWIEPSVGNGAFFKLLPQNKIGIDIKPTEFDTIQSDFLNYVLPSESPNRTSQPFIVIGNPPFGHRGVLALEFIKHAQNADFIAFILPMFFQSLGKGSIRYRVPQHLHLLYEEVLPKNSFYTPSGKDADVHCCFQIYSKNHKSQKREFSWYKDSGKEPFSEILKVVTVSLAKNRECGKEWIFNKKADFYLSSTFFKQNEVVDSFEKVKYKSGIAIIYNDLSRKDELDRLFKSADWLRYSTKATNGCYHIGKSHIFQLLQDKGFAR